MKSDDCKTWERLYDEVKEPLQRLRDQVSDVFDERFSPHGADPRMAVHQRFGSFSPRIDLTETDSAYLVTAEFPGLDAAAIEITVEEQRLILRGEKEAGEQEGEPVFRERMTGRFKRTIPFDDEIDAKRVEARASNGVLTVNVPKIASRKRRRVKITTEE